MIMPNPPITVVVPTYNGAPYLRQALESVIGQTFKDFEVIVIDDASTDGSFEIAKEYAANDSRFKLIQNEKNLGFAGNRNKAISLASGRYIAWQDQDDISLPDRLELQFSLLESDARLAMVGGAMMVFDETGELGIRRYPVNDDEIRRMIFRFSPIALPACMMRTSALLEVGGYSERWSPAGDLDMTFKIGLTHKLANIPQVAIRYRTHNNSATKHHLKRIEKDSVRLRFNYAKSRSYRMTSMDFIYNVVHYLSIWLVPPALKIWVFNKIRTSAE